MQIRSNYLLHPSGSVPDFSALCPVIFTPLAWQSCPDTHEHTAGSALNPQLFSHPEGCVLLGPRVNPQTCEFYALIHQISLSCTTGNCNSVVQTFVPFPWALKRNEDRRVVFLCHSGRREECQKKKLHSPFSLLRAKGSDLSVQRFEFVINLNL